MKSLFDTYLKFTGYDISRAGKELKQIQSLSPDEFQKWQSNKKWEIARYHFYNNAFYRKKIGKNFPDKWEDLPIMKKSDYQDDLGKLLSKGNTKTNTHVSNTSGSSGHPFFFARNKQAHGMAWAIIKDRYSWHDIKINSKQARFYGIPLETTSKLQEKIKDFVINRIRFPIFDLSDEILRKFLIKFRKVKFDFIYGYTNSMVLFARYLIKKDIVLKNECPSLKICITTSEVLTVEDRVLLSRAFGVGVVNEYGVSEVGAILAFEDKANHWLINKETILTEIVDSKNKPLSDGNIGDIVLTDLYNMAMPFIRYRVGDIGMIKKDIKVEGCKVLDSLQGRTNDTIRLPSGRVSPGLTFYYISRSILESSGVLKEFIIRQTALDTFVFDVVTDRDLYESEIDDIKNKMDSYLEPGLNLQIKRVPIINRPSSGRIKHFYSELPS